MLQNELKKKENLYKDMIDEYEKLRFRHCSVVQELDGLKEVYKRVRYFDYLTLICKLMRISFSYTYRKRSFANK